MTQLMTKPNFKINSTNEPPTHNLFSGFDSMATAISAGTF